MTKRDNFSNMRTQVEDLDRSTRVKSGVANGLIQLLLVAMFVGAGVFLWSRWNTNGQQIATKIGLTEDDPLSNRVQLLPVSLTVADIAEQEGLINTSYSPEVGRDVYTAIEQDTTENTLVKSEVVRELASEALTQVSAVDANDPTFDMDALAAQILESAAEKAAGEASVNSTELAAALLVQSDPADVESAAQLAAALIAQAPDPEPEPESLVPIEDLIRGGQNPDRLVIPAIDLDTPVEAVGFRRVQQVGGKEYVQWQVPDRFSVGWHGISAGLGEVGNTVLNGHNNVYGRVFESLDQLNAGDLILVYSNDQIYQYQISSSEIVKERGESLDVRATNAEAIQETDDERITLVSCWPFNSNTHRIIIVAKPIGILLDGDQS